ncbi:MAG: hypothetical protein RJA44_2331 [Pseudomonadota bacterium]|jgi:glyoxylase-like metal-dependent hydrolase (beta-lactamase superfamily II)
MPDLPTAPLPDHLTVLERGWLSSNNILIHGPDGVTLVDTGHGLHAAQTLALIEHALAGQPLLRIINTHLHSDHCGGNAALLQRWPVPLWLPPGQFDAVARWDDAALSYRRTGQYCPPYRGEQALRPGTTMRLGVHDWQLIAAPGHDPDALMLFEPEHGVLISADALWQNGFGVVFPELEGEAAFDDVAAVLDLIEALPVRWVIPGHGAPFSDVAAALQRARLKLQGWRREPARHERYAAKVLLKYHLMEVRQEPLAALQQWILQTPLLATLHRRAATSQSLADWGGGVLDELLAGGALLLRDDLVLDAA